MMVVMGYFMMLSALQTIPSYGRMIDELKRIGNGSSHSIM
jgi:hypothetical protein